MSERLVLTVEEAAQMLRISRGAAYAAVRAGAIPSVRLGRTIRVPHAVLLNLLNADEPAADRLDGKTPEDARHAPS